MLKDLHITQLTYACFFTAFVLLYASTLNAEEFLSDQAQEKFQIEYIVFLHQDNDSNEKNPNKQQYRPEPTSPYTRLISGFEPLSANHYPALAKEDMFLSAALLNLSKSKDVNVISYGAWQQAIPPESTLLPVSIDVLVGMSPGQFTYQDRRLEGTLTIKRSRYMHVKANLHLSDFLYYPESNLINWLLGETTNTMSLKGMLTPYSSDEIIFHKSNATRTSFNHHALLQSRRLKYSEVHYLDHPAIGLIATINKLEPEADL